jgi:hypothetical protein
MHGILCLDPQQLFTSCFSASRIVPDRARIGRIVAGVLLRHGGRVNRWIGWLPADGWGNKVACACGALCFL